MPHPLSLLMCCVHLLSPQGQLREKLRQQQQELEAMREQCLLTEEQHSLQKQLTELRKEAHRFVCRPYENNGLSPNFTDMVSIANTNSYGVE